MGKHLLKSTGCTLLNQNLLPPYSSSAKLHFTLTPLPTDACIQLVPILPKLTEAALLP